MCPDVMERLQFCSSDMSIQSSSPSHLHADSTHRPLAQVNCVTLSHCIGSVHKKTDICIAPHSRNSPLKRSRVDHTAFTLQIHHTYSPVGFQSPEGETSRDSRHLITAYYSFIDPKRMKGWVGLFGWPTVDGLPNTHINGYQSAAGQLQARESSPVRDRHSNTELHHQRKT